MLIPEMWLSDSFLAGFCFGLATMLIINWTVYEWYIKDVE
jgi:hypothetical protein